MLMLNIINFITGIVKIRISGLFPEKFINLCIAQNILLWKIIETQECFYAYIRLTDFLQIRPLVLRSRVRIKVMEYYGLPFIKKRLKKRKVLVIGAIISVVVLNVLSSFVWFVDVQGNKLVSDLDIKQIAQNNGLKVGIAKSTITVKNIENAILYHLPTVAWTSVSINGTRALIEVVEKTLPPPLESSPADLVAVKDGEITEIVLIYGEPVVKVGDRVSKGDLLIRHSLVLAEASKSIRAKGIINAKVRYEALGEAKTKEEQYLRTGQRKVAVAVDFNNQKLWLKKADVSQYSFFEKEQICKSFSKWRKGGFPVELHIDVYHELEKKWSLQSYDQAVEKAKIQALSQIQNIIPLNAQILKREIEVMSDEDNMNVNVKAIIETIEDIGQDLVIEQ